MAPRYTEICVRLLAGGSAAFAHDPVPWLISHGWSATLVEPQPSPAASLRRRYGSHALVRIVQAAVCPDGAMAAVPLFFVNGSRTLGANESDIRCLGDVVSGTASFSKAHVVAHQRFYRFTPSQCMGCSERLGRPLPPTCMKRVYTDNLDMISVPCAQPDQMPLGGRGGASASAAAIRSAHRRPHARASADGSGDSSLAAAAPRARERLASASLVVVDAEGEDDRVVGRLLEMAGGVPPPVLVYEQAHLRSSRRAALASRLRAAGLAVYNRTRARTPPGGLGPTTWSQLRHALARLDSRDNALWVARPQEV